MTDIYQKLKQSTPSNFKIAVLPDFFLDILISPNMSYQSFLKQVDDTYQRGGGNVIGPRVQIVPGGNGGNVAKTLAVLGIDTSFIAETSGVGKNLIEYYMHSLGVKTFLIESGELACSAIFEIPSQTGTSNVMLSSSGSVADFSGKKLTNEQWKALKQSNIVAITNAQNSKLEDLAETILTEIPPSTVISLDFSDLTPHTHRMKDFHQKILSHKNPPKFIVGNETEFSLLWSKVKTSPEKAIENISKEYSEIIFGLHMAHKAEIWQNGDLLAREPSYKVDVLKTTGAGDNWHAGFLTGWIIGLEYNEIARFANAVAGYQISTGKIGLLEEIIAFMINTSIYGNFQ